MGFLDELKRQAAAQTAQQNQNASANQRNAMLADAACKTAFQYWLQLAAQLNVLRPKARASYVIDKRHRLEGLPLSDVRVDARLKAERLTSAHGDAGYDHVVLQFMLRSGQHLTLKKNFLNEIEQLEGRLRQAGIRADTEAVRHPENGKLQEMRYAFDADIAASVLLTPDHANARVHFQLRNLDALETVSFDVPAFDVGSARLDELAKWLVGEPHEFLKGVHKLRRVEAP